MISDIYEENQQALFDDLFISKKKKNILKVPYEVLNFYSELNLLNYVRFKENMIN